MRTKCVTYAALLLLLSVVASAGEGDDALGAYKSADYKRAIPLLQAAAGKSPKDPVVNAALLSALVYEGRVDEASSAADADAAAFPSSPEILAARGEFALYMSDTIQAEQLFKQALKLKDDTPRAAFGLYRLFYAASLYRTARMLCLSAHAIDPDDALITLAYLSYVVPEKRDELLRPFVSSHPWLMKNFEDRADSRAEVKKELNGRKVFEHDGPPRETTLHLISLLEDPKRVRGVGLEVSLEGGRPLKLLLDTGASGILVKQAAIDRAGLKHLGSFEATGIGDKGARNTFVSVADTCSIGPLTYKTCLIRAVEGKAPISGYEDGLIGADVFSDYIVQIDFQQRSLHLTPQPERPANPQGYDRVIPPNEAGFTKVFRHGHALLVPTKLNGKTEGLFLLDTGAESSNVDSTFARLSTKIRGSEYVHVRGLSGSVKDVFEADKAEVQFSRYKQRNIGLTAFNLNNSPDHQEIRLSGILGIPVLAMFRLTIDYRNGLVNFDYKFK